ncbi:UDP-N-acetylmuramoylalanine--D-glutamate ligase [bioreactor metagenome]|uniref:UDP-N-acetylmuramoylalanine--D-glutamate ligase n=1 Tax=bioreactor metagenome TaxID=1076179 RepID=A0A645E479_9ZZZZ
MPVPADPAQDGYTFDGWTTAIPATVPEGGLTIYGSMTAVTIPPEIITEEPTPLAGASWALLNLILAIATALGSVLMFSRSGEVENGAYLKEGAIHMRRNGKDREVLKTSDILLPGAHNIENYMAAIAAVDGLVPDNIIADFAGSFGGVEHRIELCRTKDGVRFYNDSIASSPSRTIAGLRSFGKKVILIAGGYDKHIPYDVLGPEITEHVKYLVLTGATADKIRRAVETAPDYKKGSPDIVAVDDFDDAVKTAARAAREGDVVILSPASASFDHFRNFMERGKRFKDIINSL